MAKRNTVAAYGLITVAAELASRITSFKTTYTKSYNMALQVAVSCLAHAATTGDPVHLNNFFSVLKTNDRDALRNYIRRTFAMIGGWNGTETVSQEIMAGYKQAGEFLKIQAGKFRVMRNDEGTTVAAARGMFAEDGEGSLTHKMMHPDGKVWKHFLDRNNFAETKTFGDDELRKGLQTLINKAKGERKGTNADVSKELLAALVAAQATVGTPEQASRSLLN